MSTAFSEAYQQRFGGIARLYGQQALTLFRRRMFVLSASAVWDLGLRKHWHVLALVRSR